MELLTATGVPPLAAPRTMGRALGLSAIVHAALATVLVFLPARAARVDLPIEITVEVSAEPSLPLDVPRHPAPAEPIGQLVPVRAARMARPAPVVGEALKRARGAEPEAARAELMPPAVLDPADAAEPAPVVTPSVAPTSLAGAASPPRTGVAATSGAGQAGGGMVGVPGPPGVASFVAHRRTTVDRYRDQLLRTRIAAAFRYPSDARELELTGGVLVTVSIRGDGRLLDARLAGRCPHSILCADALRTIRAAAPFPPIPPELGSSLVIEVPLTYAFE